MKIKDTIKVITCSLSLLSLGYYPNNANAQEIPQGYKLELFASPLSQAEFKNKLEDFSLRANQANKAGISYTSKLGEDGIYQSELDEIDVEYTYLPVISGAIKNSDGLAFECLTSAATNWTIIYSYGLAKDGSFFVHTCQQSTPGVSNDRSICYDGVLRRTAETISNFCPQVKLTLSKNCQEFFTTDDSAGPRIPELYVGMDSSSFDYLSIFNGAKQLEEEGTSSFPRQCGIYATVKTPDGKALADVPVSLTRNVAPYIGESSSEYLRGRNTNKRGKVQINFPIFRDTKKVLDNHNDIGFPIELPIEFENLEIGNVGVEYVLSVPAYHSEYRTINWKLRMSELRYSINGYHFDNSAKMKK